MNSILNKISNNIPDITNISSFSSTPFRVKKIKKSNIIWINSRYFYENGININDNEILKKIKSELLDTFAVMSESMTELDKYLGLKKTILYADRYGGSDGSVHGGSGRCGTKGFFNAKGIGKTPLLSKAADWWHSTGLMWLNECIREAISSEIGNSELPHGAIPIIAIIDTGIEVKVKNSDEVERCGIVIRPNFLRPSHFERSIYFGTSGTTTSDQYKDAKRVEDYITWAKTSYATENLIQDFLLPMFLKFARQVGRQRAIRVWQGRFLTSNASCDGAIADFGAFRAVTSWRQAYSNKGDIFGQDGIPLAAGFKSIAFYLNKYSNFKMPNIPIKNLVNMFEIEISKEFYESCRVGFNMTQEEKSWKELKLLIEEYYNEQQKETGDIDKLTELNREWIGNAINSNYALAKSSKKLLDFCRNIRKDSSNMLLWLQPRRDMLKLTSRTETSKIIDLLQQGNGENIEIVTSHIEMRTARNRRHWEHLPHHFKIISHLEGKGTHGCLGKNILNDKGVMLLYIPKHESSCWIFGYHVPIEKINKKKVYENSTLFCIELEDSDFELNGTKCKITYNKLDIYTNVSIYNRNSYNL